MEPSRKLWTCTEYRRLTEDGFLQDGKVELINGEIWNKTAQGRRHVVAVMLMLKALAPVYGFKHIQLQSSLPLSEDSDPEPDVAALKQSLDQYIDVDPTPADTLLVVEAANTSLCADLTIKQAMYARSGIPEYWVVDIPNRLLHVFREPTADGYASETLLTTDNEVRPLAAPGSVVRVAELLP